MYGVRVVLGTDAAMWVARGSMQILFIIRWVVSLYYVGSCGYIGLKDHRWLALYLVCEFKWMINLYVDGFFEMKRR